MVLSTAHDMVFVSCTSLTGPGAAPSLMPNVGQRGSRPGGTSNTPMGKRDSTAPSTSQRLRHPYQPGGLAPPILHFHGLSELCERHGSAAPAVTCRGAACREQRTVGRVRPGGDQVEVVKSPAHFQPPVMMSDATSRSIDRPRQSAWS